MDYGKRIEKGDVVSLEELASGDLRLSPLQGPAADELCLWTVVSLKQD